MAFEQKSLGDYIEVGQRIADFREVYPEGSLQPADLAHPWEQATVTGYDKDGKEVTQTFIVYVAAAYRTPADQRPGIGIAWEVFPGRTSFTRGSEIQNAETSAWGRAIVAVLASDSKRGIASREEVAARRAEREDGLPVNKDGSLSRSQTSDEQKEKAGVMTAAQMAEHTALRPKASEQPAAERLSATPADDPFYDAPAPMEGAEDNPRSISKRQQQTMHAKFNELGIKDRTARLAWTRKALGLTALASSSDLSYRQAGDLLAALQRVGNGETT